MNDDVFGAPMLRYFTVQQDLTAAEWLAPRLHQPPFRRVDGTVPSGFASYARILHPAMDPSHQPQSWATVAESTGRTIHALVTWHELTDTGNRGDSTVRPWNGEPPEQGTLPSEELETLCQVLAPYTADADHVWCCLWEGWGWLHGSPSVSIFRSDTPVPPGLGARTLQAPRVHLPWRDYLLFLGPLDKLGTWGHQPFGKLWAQSPSLFWPADRSWCVATEVD